MTITEFLLARIAEDEWAAWLATKGPWTADHGYINAGTQPVVSGGFDSAGSLDESCRWEDAVHIARHDPVRVLAECEAKRRIVDRYIDAHERVLAYRNPRWEDGMDERDRIERRLQEARNATAEFALRALALPYVNHPDYDEAWRP